MINSTLVFVVLFTLIGTVKSQTSFGIKAGLNLADQQKKWTTSQFPPKAKTTVFCGYQAGSFVKTKLNKHLLIAAEINLSVIGSGSKIVDTDNTVYDTNERLGYIEFPLLLQYANKRIYFGMGPAISIKLFATLVGFENRNHEISDYKTFESSGNFMAGYEISKQLDINMRYSYGLSNLHKYPVHAVTKNRFLNFSLLYKLK